MDPGEGVYVAHQAGGPTNECSDADPGAPNEAGATIGPATSEPATATRTPATTAAATRAGSGATDRRTCSPAVGRGPGRVGPVGSGEDDRWGPGTGPGPDGTRNTDALPTTVPNSAAGSM